MDIAKVMVATAGKRKGGHGQHTPELEHVVELLLAEPKPRVVLEVGVETGGSLAVWAELAAPAAHIIGIDEKHIDPQGIVNDGQQLTLIEADSHSDECVARLREVLGGQLVDLLHIDGDHSYEGVQQDYIKYRPFVRPGGIILFHDVRTNDDVHRFCDKFSDMQIVHDEGMGSGLLRVDGPTVSVAIMTYARPSNLRSLFKTLDPGLVPVRVFEDKFDPTHANYVQLCKDLGIELITADEWGCIQGTAQLALEHSPESWTLLLSDDISCTPGSVKQFLSNLQVYDYTSAGLAQIPYWNTDGVDSLGSVWSAETLDTVPDNPHWRPPVPRLYVSVHGTGFGIRRSMWEMTSGFSKETWCFDEDMSARCWLHTPYSVCYFPGRPLLHHGPGAGSRPQVLNDFSSHEAWMRAWNCSKGEMDKRLRAKMDEAGGDQHPLTDARMREVIS